jgi:hypothetical protein
MKEAEFLTKYISDWRNLNEDDFNYRAARNSINASVGRNRTYRKGVSPIAKGIMRDFWIQYLSDVNFSEIQTWNDWEQGINALRSIMNKEFPSIWLNNFRISHSQKSLSVFWKYQYCRSLALNQECLSPVSMPLDRIVQNNSGLPVNQILSWGAVDSMEVYTTQINLIAKRLNLPVSALYKWEIENF